MAQREQTGDDDLARGFRLGVWTIRPDLGFITAGPTKVHLEPKQMDLLVLLARRAPDVVGKDEIFEAVWPGAYVAESGLKRNIWALRQALNDDARSPGIIKTITKRGYQLLLPVAPLDGVTNSSPAATTAVGDLEQLYHRARHLASGAPRRQIKQALDLFERVIVENPDHALSLAGKADCHSYLFMYFDGNGTHLDRALETSAMAIEIDPQLAEGRVARGLALSLERRYQAAEQEFKSALASNPELFEACYFYARTCFVQGKLEKASQLFERAAELSPDDYQTMSLLAFTRQTLNRKEQAEEMFRRTVRIVERHLESNPDNPRAVYFGAMALLELGEHQRGLELAKRSLALDPEDPYLVYGGARFYSRSGKMEQALQCFERAAEAGVIDKDWIDSRPSGESDS